MNNKMASFPYRESLSMTMDRHVEYFKTESAKNRKLGNLTKANLAEDAYGRSQLWRRMLNLEFHEGKQMDIYNRYLEEMTRCFNIENLD